MIIMLTNDNDDNNNRNIGGCWDSNNNNNYNPYILSNVPVKKCHVYLDIKMIIT